MKPTRHGTEGARFFKICMYRQKKAKTSEPRLLLVGLFLFTYSLSLSTAAHRRMHHTAVERNDNKLLPPAAFFLLRNSRSRQYDAVTHRQAERPAVRGATGEPEPLIHSRENIRDMVTRAK